jgi:polar amino acid transport system substrate-binding protein
MKVVFACGLLTLALTANATAGKLIRVAIQEDSAPKYLTGTQSLHGRVEGICPDIMRALEKQLPGTRFEFEARPQPLRRIELRMEEGELDANCLVANNDRREKFVVAPNMLFSFNYFLIARANDPVEVRSWDDVRRLGPNGKLLILSGTGITESLRSVGGLRFEESGKSASVNLRKLVMGRGRFFYYRIHDWDTQLRAAMVAGQVRILPARMDSVHFHLMFGRHVDPELPAQVAHALQELESNGTLAQIRARWQLGLPSKP